MFCLLIVVNLKYRFTQQQNITWGMGQNSTSMKNPSGLGAKCEVCALHLDTWCKQSLTNVQKQAILFRNEEWVDQFP